MSCNVSVDSDFKMPSRLTCPQRDQAWKLAPYPCVGGFWFLEFAVAAFKDYGELVTRLKTGQRLLDIGAGLGQELRALASDGAPPNTLAATDYDRALWEVGYDLFLDCTSFAGCEFIEADFITGSDHFNGHTGKFDMILATNFLHLFDIDVQADMAVRMLRLLRPVNGSLVVGLQGGTRNAPRFLVDFPMFPCTKNDFYQHSIESIQHLWSQAAGTVGLVVETAAECLDITIDPRYVRLTKIGAGEAVCRLQWSVRVTGVIHQEQTPKGREIGV